MAAAQLDAAAHDADQVGDDFGFENAGVVGFQAVQDLTADGHDGLRLRVAALLDRAHSGIALHDVQLAAGGILRAAVHELLHAVGQIHLLGHRLFDGDTRFFGVLAALLIDEHLLAGLFGLVGVLDEVDLKLMLQELGHGLGHKLVRDGLFRLVLVARAGGEAGRDKHKAVLHVGKGDRTLVLFVQTLVFQPGVDLADECRAHGAVRAAAVLEPAGVVVILQTLHGVGERERDVHLDLIVGLVGAVTARGGTGAEMHGRQGLVPYQLVGVVGDAMLVQVLEFFGVAAGPVGKDQRNTVVDDGLTAEHILEGFRRDGDVGENLGVGLPADDRAGALALERLLLQAADVPALFEVEVIVEAVAVDVGGHPLTGILGGAQAQTVQAQTEIIVAAALGVFAAGIQLAKDQVPVPALLGLVVVNGDAAAKILDLDDVVREQRDIDAVAVAVACLIDGVGNNFKNGMSAALDTVGAEDDRRAFSHTVRALQLADAVIAVFLLFFCHAAGPSEFIVKQW